MLRYSYSNLELNLDDMQFRRLCNDHLLVRILTVRGRVTEMTDPPQVPLDES